MPVHLFALCTLYKSYIPNANRKKKKNSPLFFILVVFMLALEMVNENDLTTRFPFLLNSN